MKIKSWEGMRLRYKGMRLRYKGDREGQIVTAHRNPDKSWYVCWPDGAKTNSGYASTGIDDETINNNIWELIDRCPAVDLKTANTQPNATVCIACGGKLKDPMMGPMFKYCPRCEP